MPTLSFQHMSMYTHAGIHTHTEDIQDINNCQHNNQLYEVMFVQHMWAQVPPCLW